MTFKNSALTIACVVSFSALVLRGAMVFSNGERFLEIAGALAVFFAVLVALLLSRRFLKRQYDRSPLLFSLFLFAFLTASNVVYVTSVLPRIERNSFPFFTVRRLPDHSLFSMMENRGGGVSLVYAFLGREVQYGAVFLPANSTEVDKRLLEALPGVSAVHEYDQKPDDYIGSLGLKWSVYEDPLYHAGFEYARHGEDMILGRVGELSCR